MRRIAVIMAGGSGERFWPLSRKARPKQLLRLTNPDETLLAEAVRRISPLIAPEHVYIVTSRGLTEPIRAAKIGVPARNILGEPCKRNTGGCLVYASAEILAREGIDEQGLDASQLSMAVLTADHAIPEHDKFCATVDAALTAAEKHGALATIGVPPSRPETGYGYIEVPAGAAALETGPGLAEAWPVASFREKPDAAQAAEFVAAKRFYWNSGMFFWRLDTFISELNEANPAMGGAAQELVGALQRNDGEDADRIFATLHDLSIDYALLEKAKRVVMVPAGFAWDDVGAWDALDRTMIPDSNGNITVGDPVLIDTRNSIVYSEPGAAQMAVAVVGVEGLTVVVSKDGVLVVPKDRAQDVKKAVELLKQRSATQL